MTSFSTEMADAITGERILIVAGDVDVATADQVLAAGTAALRHPDPRNLVIDLENVTFMDSTGIGALVGLRNEAAELGLEVSLHQTPPRVRRLLTITGLDVVFGTEPYTADDSAVT
jgi:anti-sigma B factor antagonist